MFAAAVKADVGDSGAAQTNGVYAHLTHDGFYFGRDTSRFLRLKSRNSVGLEQSRKRLFDRNGS